MGAVRCLPCPSPLHSAPCSGSSRPAFFHADAGHYDRQYRLAGDGPQPGRRGVGAQARGGGLHLDHGHADARIGLAGRPLRHAARLPGRDPGLRPGFGVLRAGADADAAHHRPRRAGRGRLHAVADRPAGSVAHGAGGSVHLGPGLRFHRGAGRADLRADAGRPAGAGGELALDFHDQRAHRHRRPVRLPALSARGCLERRGAFRCGGLRPAVPVHGGFFARAGPAAGEGRWAGRPRCSR